MTEQLESLVKDWEKLKENGNGYIESFQCAEKEFGRQRLCYYSSLNHESKRVYSHINSSFGSNLNDSNMGLHEAYIELRKLDKDRSHLSDDLNKLLHGSTYHSIEDDLRHFRELPLSEGGLGAMLCCGTHTDGSRWGNKYYFFIEGDHAILKRTFEEFEKNPSSIRDFAGVVFKWGKEEPHEYIHDDQVRALRGKKSREYDLLFPELKRLYLLDVGDDYIPPQKKFWVFRVKPKRKLDVKVIEIK